MPIEERPSLVTIMGIATILVGIYYMADMLWLSATALRNVMLPDALIVTIFGIALMAFGFGSLLGWGWTWYFAIGLVILFNILQFIIWMKSGFYPGGLFTIIFVYILSSLFLGYLYAPSTRAWFGKDEIVFTFPGRSLFR